MNKSNNLNIIFVYINEAHATDVWPIGLSARTLNNSHKIIEDRQYCANKFCNEFDFEIPTYLDNMNNDVQNELSSWPFRWFLIEYNGETKSFIFKKIGEPENGEFNFSF